MSRRRNDSRLYAGRGEAWWDQRDPFARSLREVNRLRLRLLGRLLQRLPPRPLVLDIGCGGGLLAVPLAARGARVLGIDLEPAGLRAAVCRGGSYCRADAARLPVADGGFDLVCLADVVEHVDDWRRVLAAAARALAPGGLLYLNTLTAGWRSRALAVWLGEGLGLGPRGTHDARRFVAPASLARAAAAEGLQLRGLIGLAPDLPKTLRARWLRLRFSRRISSEYAAWWQKSRGHFQHPGRSFSQERGH